MNLVHMGPPGVHSPDITLFPPNFSHSSTLSIEQLTYFCALLNAAKRANRMGCFFVYFAVLSFASGCLLIIESAPHKDVHDVNEQLREQGYETLTSEDDFTKSVTCTSCGWKITYQDSAKAVWLVKRHSNENSHKVKAGWFLSTDNKVLASKPKGM